LRSKNVKLKRAFGWWESNSFPLIFQIVVILLKIRVGLISHINYQVVSYRKTYKGALYSICKEIQMVLKEMYQNAERYTGKIIAGCLLLVLSAVSLDSILNTRKGSFIDLQTEQKYEYQLVHRGNPNNLYVWNEDSHPLLFAQKIREFDGDGKIDHIGGFTYPRMPFEYNMLNARPDLREKSQRLYDLALADSQ